MHSDVLTLFFRERGSDMSSYMLEADLDQRWHVSIVLIRLCSVTLLVGCCLPVDIDRCPEVQEERQR